MKNSIQYVITAVVAIVAIVVVSIFIRSSNRRFTQTLEGLNDTLTTQGGQVQPAAPVEQGGNASSVDIILPPAGESGTVAVIPVTNAPATAAPVTQTPAANDTPATQAPVSDAPATQAPAAAPTGDAQTLAYLNTAVNTMRTTPNFSAVKDQVIDIQLTDCSLSAFTSIINGIISGMTGDESHSFTFANGVATDPETKQPVSAKTAIPPTDKDFTLMQEGVQSMTSTSDGTNTTYTIVLKPETTSLENTVPYYHAMAMDHFDITTLDIPITITAADFNYAGATIDITVDGQGRVVRYHENMPIQGVGAGKMGFMSADVTIEGYLDETWTITY